MIMWPRYDVIPSRSVLFIACVIYLYLKGALPNWRLLRGCLLWSCDLLIFVVPLRNLCCHHVTDYDPDRRPRRTQVGRFRNEEVNERVCEICTLLEIEDEEHFVCVCPAYDQFRQILFNTAREINNQFDTLTTRDKCIYVMDDVWRRVAKFVKDAWHQRKRQLFVVQ